MKNLSYKIADAIRGYVNSQDYLEVIPKYLLIGHEESKNKSYIEKILRSSDIKKELENTFKQIEKENTQLQGVFENLTADLELTEQVLYKLLTIIKESNLKTDEWKIALDEVINEINESTGKNTIEATTPSYLNELSINIINPIEGTFYDGTCGIGQTLTQASNNAKENNKSLELYGQEISSKLGAICKIRLFMNENLNSQIKIGNTLTEPAFLENNELKKFDNIIMNFPFGMTWKEEQEYIEKDIYNRFIFGNPPVSNSEWLFISHMIKSLKENGKGLAITTSGVLFRGAKEEAIRKNILSLDCIEAVISLAPVIPSTGVPVNMLVINMNKSEELKNKILFINAQNMYEAKNRSQKILTKDNINTIVDIYRNKKEIAEVSSIVDIKDLEGSNLLPDKNVLKTETINDEFGAIRFKKEKLNELNNCKTLGDIGDFYRGINVIGSNVEESKDGEYKIINFSDVKDGEIDIESLSRYNIKNNARVEAYTVKEGDILISSRGANTKVSIVPPHEGKVLISQNFISFRLNDENNSEYVKAFLESPLGQFLIESKQAGTSIITLNAKDLMKIPVMLVQKHEQVAIVENYKKEYNRIQKEIEELNKKLKESKLKLYEQMGVTSTFEIL